MNPHDDKDIDSVSVDLPLLRSDGEITITTKNMDGPIREIIRILESCSKPETTISDEERADNEFLLARVLPLFHEFESIEEERHKALLLLFRKRLATPDNLEMLLRMVDTEIQTGRVRCLAFILLTKVVQLDFVWSLKMKDGSYFATSYLATCLAALEIEANKDKDNRHTVRSCPCAYNATMFINMAMYMNKDAPVTVIERVHSFNWAQILPNAITKEFATEPNK
jgi:hypothetical protein